MKKLIDKLDANKVLSKEEFVLLIENRNEETAEYLFKKAVKVRQEYYGNDVYIRGLIEFTNYCKNDCFYCGIRRSNKNAERYRLSKEEILLCCREGYALGYRTFVLQGGEDPFFTPEKITDIVRSIKNEYPDCAVTLSVGEQTRETYKLWREAGADRYLLRHETASGEHYKKLHPQKMLFENRCRCLFDLKDLGYQTGCGFMVGSPYQTAENLAEDLLFIKELNPEMVGIGPFIPQHDTPLGNEKAGTLELTLFMLGIIRLMLPNVLLPATTALGTIHPNGRELGVMAGANVCMPNLSPVSVRKKYSLYDNKICTGDESAQCRSCLESRMEKIGYKIAVNRGDYINLSEERKS